MEQIARLDDLQALVEQRRRVDGDLGAHVPGGVAQRVAHGHVRELPRRSAARRGRRRPSATGGRSRRPGRSRGTGRWPTARCPPGELAAEIAQRLLHQQVPQTMLSLLASATRLPALSAHQQRLERGKSADAVDHERRLVKRSELGKRALPRSRRRSPPESPPARADGGRRHTGASSGAPARSAGRCSRWPKCRTAGTV